MVNDKLLFKWLLDKNIEWKCEIFGCGWLLLIVWGELVFLMIVELDGEVDEDVKGFYFGGE